MLFRSLQLRYKSNLEHWQNEIAESHEQAASDDSDASRAAESNVDAVAVDESAVDSKEG